jgi:hypothetical protein
MAGGTPYRYYVGDKHLDKEDRMVLATWSGQDVPGKGPVHLALTPEQWGDLSTCLAMLGKVWRPKD